jgi:4-hydroxy-2-oxoglutarate aldolase
MDRNLPVNSCGGSIAKLVRLSATIKADPSINAARPYPFLLLDGLIADLAPWMQCGGHGTVSGIPNFAPAASMRLWALLNKGELSNEESEEASNIQAILSHADVAAVPAGVRGMSMYIESASSGFVSNSWSEYVLNALHGYGIAPRKPLLPLSRTEGEGLMAQFKEMLELEKTYHNASWAKSWY